jgi:hypothetical protein
MTVIWAGQIVNVSLVLGTLGPCGCCRLLLPLNAELLTLKHQACRTAVATIARSQAHGLASAFWSHIVAFSSDRRP